VLELTGERLKEAIRGVVRIWPRIPGLDASDGALRGATCSVTRGRVIAGGEADARDLGPVADGNVDARDLGPVADSEADARNRELVAGGNVDIREVADGEADTRDLGLDAGGEAGSSSR
jgi:hypothetical protein